MTALEAKLRVYYGNGPPNNPQAGYLGVISVICRITKGLSVQDRGQIAMIGPYPVWYIPLMLVNRIQRSD